MAKREIKDMTESIRGRLKNIARETKRDFDAVLLQFFQERFLYRLSISPFRENFILKGALLLMVKSITPFRPTKDIDFMGRGIGGDSNRIKMIFKNIADIHYLATANTFMSKRLINVLNATLKKRETDKIQRTVVFSEEFKNDKMKQVQWAAFLRKNKLPSEQSFAVVVEKIQQFLEPLLDGSLKNDTIYSWDKEKWIWVVDND